MARDAFRIMITVTRSFSPIALGILLSFSGTAFALEGGGEADVLARAAVEGPVESVAPDPPRVDNVPLERLERWRAMSPEERERIRERYRRWKELPPEKRERIIERRRRWKELPEERRSYLKERREMFKGAGPEDRVVVRKFFDRMHSLPPPERRAAREKVWEWRSLPRVEREEAMRSWRFYRGLSERERDTLRWFLFAPPGERHGSGGPPPP